MYERQTLIKGLNFFYRTMVASAPLLEFAIPKASGDVLRYYKQHLEEERGHEDMLKDDLDRLGVKDIPDSFEAAMLAGAQYYLIAHDHPAMLLGYMAAMERNQLTPAMVDLISEAHGTEMTCLKHHAVHDTKHKADLERVIQQLDTRLRDRVVWNEVNVIDFLERALA